MEKMNYDLILIPLLEGHYFFIIAMVGVIARNLFLTYTEKEFIPLAIKLKGIAPFFYGLISAISLAGMVLFVLAQSSFGYSNIFMVIITLVIMILEIKRHKKMRVIKSTDIKRQEEFIQFSKKIYIIDLCLILLSTVIAKIF